MTGDIDTSTKSDKEDLIVSYLGLRKTVGTVGVLLPITLLITTIVNSDVGMKKSISHYYHEPATLPIFVGALMIIGAFLGSYRGFRADDDERVSDRTLALIAATGAILTALLPTDDVMQPETIIGTLHFMSAAAFLLAIGALSFFKFSRSHSHRLFYKTMGGIIFASLSLIGLIFAFSLDERDWMPYTWLFWLEAIAVWAFGASWLVKGKLLEDQYGAKVMNWFKNLT